MVARYSVVVWKGNSGQCIAFFFFVISDISPDGCIKVFQVYEDSPELKLRNMSSCPTIEKAFFISCTINAILWLALANKMCLTWL